MSWCVSVCACVCACVSARMGRSTRREGFGGAIRHFVEPRANRSSSAVRRIQRLLCRGRGVLSGDSAGQSWHLAQFIQTGSLKSWPAFWAQASGAGVGISRGRSNSRLPTPAQPPTPLAPRWGVGVCVCCCFPLGSLSLWLGSCRTPAPLGCAVTEVAFCFVYP